MKNIQIVIITLCCVFAYFGVSSCKSRSSENIRLDRFLGEWDLESDCTTGPPFKATTLGWPKTVIVAKAKPDGIHFDKPGCGENDFGTNLFLYFDANKSHISLIQVTAVFCEVIISATGVVARFFLTIQKKLVLLKQVKILRLK